MTTINPIILKTLKTMIEEDPDIPSEIEGLVKKLLEIESVSGSFTGGIEKLYEQVLQTYAENSDVAKWSEKYAH